MKKVKALYSNEVFSFQPLHLKLSKAPPQRKLGVNPLLLTVDGSVEVDLLRHAQDFELDLDTENCPVLSRRAFLENGDLKHADSIIAHSPALRRCGMDILDAIATHLDTNGQLAVIGRFTVTNKKTPSPPSDETDNPLPVWAYLLNQAKRCGLDFIYGQSILVNTSNSLDSPSPLALAIFRKNQANLRWRLTTTGQKESHAVRMLFGDVFSPSAMSQKHWDWKYGKNRGIGIGAWRGDKLIAHYGGVWRNILYRGKTVTAVQICDVMVSPRERAVMSKNGVFFRVAATFPECYTGYGAKALVGFGFPSRRHFRLAERLGLYAEADSIVEISWPRGPHLQGKKRRKKITVPTLQSVSVAELHQRAGNIDQLWQNMKDSLPSQLVGLRDWPYFRWRYLDHPSKNYAFAILQSPLTRKWKSLAVLSEEENGLYLRDVIGDCRHVQKLIEALRHTHLWETPHLKTWITRSQLNYFRTPEAEEKDLDIPVPHSIWTSGPSVESIKDSWWLTAGDTDFL